MSRIYKLEDFYVKEMLKEAVPGIASDGTPEPDDQYKNVDTYVEALLDDPEMLRAVIQDIKNDGLELSWEQLKIYAEKDERLAEWRARLSNPGT